MKFLFNTENVMLDNQEFLTFKNKRIFISDTFICDDYQYVCDDEMISFALEFYKSNNKNTTEPHQTDLIPVILMRKFIECVMKKCNINHFSIINLNNKIQVNILQNIIFSKETNIDINVISWLFRIKINTVDGYIKINNIDILTIDRFPTYINSFVSIKDCNRLMLLDMSETVLCSDSISIINIPFLYKIDASNINVDRFVVSGCNIYDTTTMPTQCNTLELTFNNINTLDLCNTKIAKDLILTNNMTAKVKNISHLTSSTYVNSIDLSNNKLNSIEDFGNYCFPNVDLSNNMIDTFPKKMKVFSNIDLKNNPIYKNISNTRINKTLIYKNEKNLRTFYKIGFMQKLKLTKEQSFAYGF